MLKPMEEFANSEHIQSKRNLLGARIFFFFKSQALISRLCSARHP